MTLADVLVSSAMRLLIGFLLVFLLFGCTTSEKKDTVPAKNESVEKIEEPKEEKIEVTTCTDSDNGQDIEVAGVTRVNDHVEFDRCSDTLSVDEYYCDGIALKKRTRVCPQNYACEEGKCIEKEITVTNCTDSDGQELRIKGTVTHGSEMYEDTCTSMQNVKEYYCRDNEIKNTIINCPSGTECRSGACVQYAPRCLENDSGINATAYGEINLDTGTGIFNLYKDSCIDEKTVKEYYCDSGSVTTTNITCSGGSRCTNGACQRIVECRESDFGFDSRTKGTVTANENNQGGSVVRTYTDECINSDTLREYYCFEDEVVTQNVVCRCNGGTCVN